MSVLLPIEGLTMEELRKELKEMRSISVQYGQSCISLLNLVTTWEHRYEDVSQKAAQMSTLLDCARGHRHSLLSYMDWLASYIDDGASMQSVKEHLVAKVAKFKYLLGQT